MRWASDGFGTSESTLCPDGLRAEVEAFERQVHDRLGGHARRVAYQIAFGNPALLRLRVVSRDGQNLRINVDSGVTITDSSMSPESMSIGAVAYTNAYAGATATTLFALDASGSLTRIGGDPATAGACPDDASNPNCGNVTMVGSLGVANVTDVNGFDIDGDPATATSAFAALTIGDATSSSLYVIDLATGAATLPAGVANPTIGGGEALRELTLAANPVVPPAQ